MVDAVRCAIDVQSGMVERKAGLPPERRIEFRAGIQSGNSVFLAQRERVIEGMRLAGVPEG